MDGFGKTSCMYNCTLPPHVDDIMAKGQEISRGVDGLAGPFALGLGQNGQTGIVTKAL